MNKADLLLAKKTILAHQVKLESKQIKEQLSHRRPNTSIGSLSASALHTLRSSNSRSLSNFAGSENGEGLASPDVRQSPSSVASSSQRSQLSSQQFADNRPPTTSSTTSASLRRSASTPLEPPRSSGSGFGSRLALELAQRSVTDKTNLRKTQAAVSKAVEEEMMRTQRLSQGTPGSRQSTQRRPSTSGSQNSSSGRSTHQYTNNNNRHNATNHTSHLSAIDEAQEEDSGGGGGTNPTSLMPGENDANYFMPKKKILRADGASLHDIYLSKKGDTWGSILKAQIREDESNKIKLKQQRQHENDEYGRLLREQVRNEEHRKALEQSSNDSFAALENASAKRMEDMQKSRTQAAIDRHKQFVANAMEDIALKEKLRQEDLKHELRASTIMMNNAKRLMMEEEEKRQRDRAAMKDYQDRIYQENIDNIRRRQESKLNSHAEDKRIIAEQERIFQREKQRREAELSDRVKRSTEGPAHFIVQKIVDLKKTKENEFYTTLFQADNSLNKQLSTSEMAAKQRAATNGQNLELEWQLNSTLKMQKKAQDEERNRAIQAKMSDILAKQEQEDLLKREKQRQAQKQYQESLDRQLEELRQRSFDSLKKTMSEAELKFNADLIRKTGISCD